nr:unnamed protein product [Spirometra erinaceieuropaei]
MSNDNVTYLLEGHPYFCFRKKWKKRYCVIVKRSSISMHCLSRLSLLLICTNSVFCTTFDDFDELQLWAQTLERSLIRCRFFATACYAAKASNLRVHMSHPINRLSFTFSAPGLNRPLSNLRTSFEGVHRASPSFSLQSLRELFHRRLNSHAPDIAKNGVVGEEAFCDGCLHVTQDRLCFVLMPSDGQPTLLASWLFDSGNLLAYGTGRFAMPLPPSTPNQQLVTDAAKSCRLAFYLISSTRMRNAPGLHIFVCDQAAEVSQWIQRATRPTCLLHERRWVTSIVSQLGSPSLRSPLASTSWRQRCFSDPIASISNDQSRAWTTLGSSPNTRRDVDHNGPWGEQHTRSVTQDLSEDHGNCPSLATRNPPAGLTHPTNSAADGERLSSPPYHATKSSSSLFGDPLGPEPPAKESSASRLNNGCYADNSPNSLENPLGKFFVSKQLAKTSGICESEPARPASDEVDGPGSAVETNSGLPCTSKGDRHAVVALPSTSFSSAYSPNAYQSSPRNPADGYRRTENYIQPTPRRPLPCRWSAPVSSPAPLTQTKTLRNSLVWPTSVSTTASPSSRNRTISEGFTASAVRSSNYRRLLSPSTLSSLGELSLDQLTQVCASAYWEAAPLMEKPHTGHLYVSRDEVLQAAHQRPTRGWRGDASGDSGGRPPRGGGDDGSDSANPFPHRGCGNLSYAGSNLHQRRQPSPGRDPLQSAVGACDTEAFQPLPTSSDANPGIQSHESRHSPKVQAPAVQSPSSPYVNVVVDVLTTSAAPSTSPSRSTTPPPLVARQDPENYLRPVLTDVHAAGCRHPVPRWPQPVAQFSEYLNVGRPVPTSFLDTTASYVSQLAEERRFDVTSPSVLTPRTAPERPTRSDPPISHSEDSEKPFASASPSAVPAQLLNYSTLTFPQSNLQSSVVATSENNSHFAELTGAGSSRPRTTSGLDEMAASTMATASDPGCSQSQGCNYVLIDCVSTHALSQMVHELADPPDAQPPDVHLRSEVTTPEPTTPRTVTTGEMVDGEPDRPASRRSARSRGFCGILLPQLSTGTDIELTNFVNPPGCSSGSTRVSSQSDQCFSSPRFFHLRHRLGRFRLRTTR